MKNDSNNFNTQLSNEEENLNIDQISLSKNNQNDLVNKDIIFKDFETGLNISDIINNELKPEKNSKNISQFENTSIDKSFGEDFDNFNKSNIANREIIESSIQNIQIDLNNENINKENKITKKIRTKDDLNNTPIPIFECLFCTTNAVLVFQHFINEILSDKYLLQTSIYDINDLDKLICNKRYINKDDKNEKLFNLLIKNTEYLKIDIPNEESIKYFKSNFFINLCHKNEIDNHILFKQKIEDNIVRKKKDFYFKGINKIPRNSMNNKCLFNSTNSLINNFNSLSGLVEPLQQINVNNNVVKNNYTNSNNSINFNSISLNNNDFNFYCKNNNNNNMLDYIVEKIEKNDESVNYAEDKEEILDIFKFDLSRKITKKDVKWGQKYYDIWNPNISSDFEEIDNDENEFNSIGNNINEEYKNKSITMNINNKFFANNKNINKSMGYIKYNMPKKSNKIFTFNKNKENKNNKKKNNIININNNISNNLNINYIPIDKAIQITSNNNSIKINDLNASKEKDIINYPKSKNKSSTNININKSHDLSKLSNKCINNYYNFNHNYSNNHLLFLSGVSNMKSFGSTTNSSYNFNKSANIIRKSFQKIKHNNKKEKNGNEKSIQYISSAKNNNNLSKKYSIGVSINLKSNSSVKSNGIIDILNPKEISNFQININKNINNVSDIIKNKKKSFHSSKNNNLYNIFNNIKISNSNHNRTKSNNNIKNPSKSVGKCKYKNQQKKNKYSIYQKDNTKKQKHFNFSCDKQRAKKAISRTKNLLISSNSIINKNNKESLYVKSLGLSFGSNDNIATENNNNAIINSISNMNNSNSINNYYNNSPNKFNQTYYYNKNKKESKNKINDLISLINNKVHNNIHQYFYLNKNNNIRKFKNDSVNFLNSDLYLDKYKYKK